MLSQLTLLVMGLDNPAGVIMALLWEVGDGDVHHCHLNSGHPRYVVVWKVVDKEIKIMKIRFVVPHGSVNYSRFK